MELLLWRWSTLVQVTSDLIIAIFFVVLARSVGRTELRAWVSGWLANLAALSITIVFWLTQPQSLIAFAIFSGFYLFATTMFVVLLVAGTAGFLDRQAVPIPYRMLIIGVAIFSATLPMTRLAIREFDAVWLALARVEIAAVAAVIMLRLYRVPWPDKAHLPALLLTAFGVVLGFPRGPNVAELADVALVTGAEHPGEELSDAF